MNDSELKIDLGPLHAIPPGQGRNFEFAGERIAVFHTRAGEVFAVQAACPHKNGPLADGLVGGNTVICPLHAWKFDLETGESLLGGCKLKTYKVGLEGANVVLRWSVPVLSEAAV